MLSINSAVAGLGLSLVSLSCGIVFSTKLGISSVENPRAESPLGIPKCCMYLHS